MRPEMTRRLTLPSTPARTRPLTVPLDLTGHKADDKHTLARLVRPRGGGHGDAGLIRQSAAEQQNLRQNEQHEQH